MLFLKGTDDFALIFVWLEQMHVSRPRQKRIDSTSVLNMK